MDHSSYASRDPSHLSDESINPDNRKPHLSHDPGAWRKPKKSVSFGDRGIIRSPSLQSSATRTNVIQSERISILLDREEPWMSALPGKVHSKDDRVCGKSKSPSLTSTDSGAPPVKKVKTSDEYTKILWCIKLPTKKRKKEQDELSRSESLDKTKSANLQPHRSRSTVSTISGKSVTSSNYSPRSGSVHHAGKMAKRPATPHKDSRSFPQDKPKDSRKPAKRKAAERKSQNQPHATHSPHQHKPQHHQPVHQRPKTPPTPIQRQSSHHRTQTSPTPTQGQPGHQRAQTPPTPTRSQPGHQRAQTPPTPTRRQPRHQRPHTPPTQDQPRHQRPHTPPTPARSPSRHQHPHTPPTPAQRQPRHQRPQTPPTQPQPRHRRAKSPPTPTRRQHRHQQAQPSTTPKHLSAHKQTQSPPTAIQRRPKHKRPKHYRSEKGQPEHHQPDSHPAGHEHPKHHPPEGHESPHYHKLHRQSQRHPQPKHDQSPHKLHHQQLEKEANQPRQHSPKQRPSEPQKQVPPAKQTQKPHPLERRPHFEPEYDSISNWSSGTSYDDDSTEDSKSGGQYSNKEQPSDEKLSFARCCRFPKLRKQRTASIVSDDFDVSSISSGGSQGRKRRKRRPRRKRSLDSLASARMKVEDPANLNAHQRTHYRLEHPELFVDNKSPSEKWSLYDPKGSRDTIRSTPKYHYYTPPQSARDGTDSTPNSQRRVQIAPGSPNKAQKGKTAGGPRSRSSSDEKGKRKEKNKGKGDRKRRKRGESGDGTRKQAKKKSDGSDSEGEKPRIARTALKGQPDEGGMPAAAGPDGEENKDLSPKDSIRTSKDDTKDGGRRGSRRLGRDSWLGGARRSIQTVRIADENFEYTHEPDSSSETSDDSFPEDIVTYTSLFLESDRPKPKENKWNALSSIALLFTPRESLAEDKEDGLFRTPTWYSIRMQENDYDPYKHRRIPKPISNIGTMLHIIKCCTGTGILTMPYGFMHAGLFNGVTCTLFILLFSSYCVNVLTRCQYIICKRNRVPMITFADTLVAALTVGPISLRKLAKYSGTFLEAVIIFDHLLIASIYALFICTIFKDLSDSYTNETAKQLDMHFFLLFSSIFLISISMFRTIRAHTNLALIGNCLVFFSVAMLFTFALRSWKESSNAEIVASPRHFPIFFGTALFVFDSISNIVVIENNMRHPEVFGGFLGLFNMSMIFGAVIITAVGFLGYLRFGSEIKPLVILNLPPRDPVGNMVHFTFAIALLLSYGMQSYVPVKYFIRRVKHSPHPLIWEYFIRVSCAMAPVIVASTVPRLGVVVPLFGALCGPFLKFQVPALIEYCLKYSDGLPNRCWMVIIDILIMVFGVIGMILGIYFSLHLLVTHEP